MYWAVGTPSAASGGRMDHRWIERSRDADASVPQSGLKATEYTASWWPGSAAASSNGCRAVCPAAHSRTIRSR